jgi:hypothetical protein
MWKNIVQLDRPQMEIWLMRIACWLPTDTNTDSEYVILILARIYARTRLTVTYTHVSCPVHHILLNNIMMCCGLTGASSIKQESCLYRSSLLLLLIFEIFQQ